MSLLAQSVDWLSAGLRLQLGVHRKWSSDCQTGALDPTETSASISCCSGEAGFSPYQSTRFRP
jgi:hypothetical protein